MSALLVILGGALGAASRYLVDSALSAALPGRLPIGTLVVNLLGSLALGVATGMLTTGGSAYALLATGVCGAFTTWSTLAVEVVDLMRAGPALGIAYLAVTLVGGLGLAGLGLLATGGLAV